MGDVIIAVQIISISVALRWVCGLYRGVVTGNEQFVWLSGFNSLIATLRFVIVLPVMFFLGFTPLVFFLHQLIVAILEFFGLLLKGRSLLPNKETLSQSIGYSLKSILPVLRFALTIAFTSALWVVVIQMDKLSLSGILPLDEYGYFTLGVLVAGGIMSISGPVSKAIMPRMARLQAEDRKNEMIKIYRDSTQVVTVFAGTVAITMVVCAKPLLFLWTGDIALAESVAPILKLYAITNGILCLIAFPYYLQYAKGDVRYNLIGNIFLLLVLTPSVIYIAPVYGGVGTGWLWLITSASYLFVWLAYVHHRLEPGLHMKWIVKDILVIVMPASLIGSMTLLFEFEYDNRYQSLGYVIIMGVMLLVCSSFSSSTVKAYIAKNVLGKLSKRD
ncbi:MATE family efflux transporter [Halopseudomonas litoralis]|uniref:polysaccharide biosynthesis protein n=1 Tax=Halopseudomonas litoralis TaxID=797277 RepID=UPI000A56C240|nr:polysaccharide biosynthesis protein [Halopseudomonas litoralis]